MVDAGAVAEKSLKTMKAVMMEPCEWSQHFWSATLPMVVYSTLLVVRPNRLGDGWYCTLPVV